MRWRPSFLGFLLIVVGVGYLLNLLHVLPDLLTFGVLWPLVIALYGLWELRDIRRGKIPWWGLFLLTFGGLLFLKNTHWVPTLSGVDSWDFLWALLLVFWGLSLLTPRRFGRMRTPFVNFRVNGDTSVNWVDAEEIAGAFRNRRRSRGASSRRMIGDLSVGAHPWVLHDMALWNGIGDIRLNLATAHVEDGTYHLDVGGLIGDIRILVPGTIAVMVEAQLKVGDIHVFGNHQDGLGRHVHHEDPNFAEASKKVVIDAQLLVGDIQIVRV